MGTARLPVRRTYSGFRRGTACVLAMAACTPGALPKPPTRTVVVHPPAPSIPAEPGAAYKLEMGPYHVATVGRLVLHDSKRNRDVSMTLRYPKTTDAGRTFPLVVFSHGSGGSRDDFAELSAHWAGHGYVVIHPMHSDSLAIRRGHGEKIDLRKEMKTIGSKIDSHDRLADVEFILDSLDAIESKVDGLHGKDGPGRIDREHIAVAGHSAGAFTAQVALGVRVRGPRWGGVDVKGFGDARVKCAIVMAGPGEPASDFTKDSWWDLDKPLLEILGLQDAPAGADDTPQARRRPFDYSKPGDKYLITIAGATRHSFAGRGACDTLGEKPVTAIRLITDTVAAGTLAFLDRYLKDRHDAGVYLTDDRLSRLSDGNATVETR